MADLLAHHCTLDYSHPQTLGLPLQDVISQHHIIISHTTDVAGPQAIQFSTCNMGRQTLAGSHVQSEMDSEEASMQMAIFARGCALFGTGLLPSKCLMVNLPFKWNDPCAGLFAS